jgi:hypothetical protein
VKEKNKIVFYLPSEINLPELGKKLVQYFRKLNEPINIDVDSFIKHYNPQ